MRVGNLEQQNHVMEKKNLSHLSRITKHTIPQAFHEMIF